MKSYGVTFQNKYNRTIEYKKTTGKLNFKTYVENFRMSDAIHWA